MDAIINAAPYRIGGESGEAELSILNALRTQAEDGAFVELRCGAKVKVYEDPITCKQLESENAILCERVNPGDEDTEPWMVAFIDVDGVDGGSVVERRINREKH
jgi:hypothetical protein